VHSAKHLCHLAANENVTHTVCYFINVTVPRRTLSPNVVRIYPQIVFKNPANTQTEEKLRAFRSLLALWGYAYMNTEVSCKLYSVISPVFAVLDILHEDPRGREERNPDEKYDAKCVKLNNNHIEDATGLMSVLEEIIVQPAAITWIDMSFNSLQKIDPVCKNS